MRSANAAKFDRKSGGAKPRDLRFTFRVLELLAHADAQALHLAIQMTPLQPQRFRSPAYVPVALINLLQNVIPFIGFPRLVQGADFLSLAAITAENEHR